MFERGDSVWWRDRQCFVRTVDPPGAPGRVELEERGSRERHLVALSDLPSGMVERVHRYGHGGGGLTFPQQRVTNLGRTVTVSRVEKDPDRFVFGQAGRDVATLWLEDERRPDEPWARLGWRLSFPDGTLRVLAAPADDPPVSGALFFVDVALREADAV
jgi:hypothetical protein